jgi:hypothetical protein
MDCDKPKSSRRLELEAEGWERKTVTDKPRLPELVELYESLGFEVHVEPFTPGSEDCSTCMAAEPDRYKVLYVRLRKGPPPADRHNNT